MRIDEKRCSVIVRVILPNEIKPMEDIQCANEPNHHGDHLMVVTREMLDET